MGPLYAWAGSRPARSRGATSVVLPWTEEVICGTDLEELVSWQHNDIPRPIPALSSRQIGSSHVAGIAFAISPAGGRFLKLASPIGCGDGIAIKSNHLVGGMVDLFRKLGALQGTTWEIDARRTEEMLDGRARFAPRRPRGTLGTTAAARLRGRDQIGKNAFPAPMAKLCRRGKFECRCNTTLLYGRLASDHGLCYCVEACKPVVCPGWRLSLG